MLEAAGVVDRLRREGVQAGDTVAIGDVMEFQWSDDRSHGALYEAWRSQRTVVRPYARG